MSTQTPWSFQDNTRTTFGRCERCEGELFVGETHACAPVNARTGVPPRESSASNPPPTPAANTPGAPASRPTTPGRLSAPLRPARKDASANPTPSLGAPHVPGAPLKAAARRADSAARPTPLPASGALSVGLSERLAAAEALLKRAGAGLHPTQVALSREILAFLSTPGTRGAPSHPVALPPGTPAPTAPRCPVHGAAPCIRWVHEGRILEHVNYHEMARAIIEGRAIPAPDSAED